VLVLLTLTALFFLELAFTADRPWLLLPTDREMQMLNLNNSIRNATASGIRTPDTMAALPQTVRPQPSPRFPDLLAFVVALTGPERFAATTVFRRDGYRVHEADSLDEAVRWFEELGPAHPLFQKGRPLLFVTSDNASDDLERINQARSACPNLFIIIATDHFCSVAPADLVSLPRLFTSRQIREVLDGSSQAPGS
jgi:hypothetical protein